MSRVSCWVSEKGLEIGIVYLEAPEKESKSKG
jgi:hypothetical protein